VPDDAADEFLGDNALAERLSVTPTHVWRMYKRGILPDPYRLGRAVRWRWSEVLEAIAKTKTSPREHEMQRLTEARTAARERKARAREHT
jgi:predicted DNA-binding transcriptional regulator AlpA